MAVVMTLCAACLRLHHSLQVGHDHLASEGRSKHPADVQTCIYLMMDLREQHEQRQSGYLPKSFNSGKLLEFTTVWFDKLTELLFVRVSFQLSA